MAHSALFSSQFSCVISFDTVDSEGFMENSADPEQLASDADLGLHCFLNRIYPSSAGPRH